MKVTRHLIVLSSWLFFSCGEDFSIPSVISEDMTLSKGTYSIEEVINITNDATLTIEPGTELIFKKYSGIDIRDDATMQAVGTESSPIIFTSEQKVRGAWDGLFFDGGNRESRLEHVIIEYGGGHPCVGKDGYGANLQVFLTEKIGIENTTLRESSGYGFCFIGDPSITSFANNTITSNETGAGLVEALTVDMLDPSSSFSGNEKDWVVIDSDYENDRNQTWQDIGVAYLVRDRLVTSGQLTVEAGTTILFDQHSKLTAAWGGVLTAIGTESNPITFTGLRKEPGSWDEIVLFPGPDTHRLMYVTIEYGGSYGGTSNANIILASTEQDTNDVVIESCSIQQSAGFGIIVDKMTVVNGEESTVNNLLSSNTFSDNTAGDIYKEE